MGGDVGSKPPKSITFAIIYRLWKSTSESQQKKEKEDSQIMLKQVEKSVRFFNKILFVCQKIKDLPHDWH